jgi:hypothetical protein
MRIALILLGLAGQPIVDVADTQRDPVYRETEVRLSRPLLDGERFDPQEFDPASKEKFAIADRKAERAVGDVERDSKFIQRFWAAKKRVLRDQFGIEWKTPAELNPGIAYANYGQPKITDAESRALRALVAPRLSGATEEVLSIDRSFEGVASVWTRDDRFDQVRVYRFAGHDQLWKFIDVAEVEE